MRWVQGQIRVLDLIVVPTPVLIPGQALIVVPTPVLIQDPIGDQDTIEDRIPVLILDPI